MTLKYLILAVLSLSISISLASPLFAQEVNFNAAYIISDQEILDTGAMTQTDIQDLLQAKNSYLATYQVVDPNGLTMSASQAIYDRAITNGVSPKFIIVLL